MPKYRDGRMVEPRQNKVRHYDDAPCPRFKGKGSVATCQLTLEPPAEEEEFRKYLETQPDRVRTWESEIETILQEQAAYAARKAAALLPEEESVEIIHADDLSTPQPFTVSDMLEELRWQQWAESIWGPEEATCAKLFELGNMSHALTYEPDGSGFFIAASLGQEARQAFYAQ